MLCAMRVRRLASLGLCLLLTAVARAQDARRVARLDLGAPAITPFFVHATVPIPKGVYPRPDGKTPFQIESHAEGRPRVPAQVAIVSRYPTGEADVVELIAPVALATNERPGDRVSFDVFLEPSDIATEPELSPAVVALGTPGARIGLRTTDVHGNFYWADLGPDPKAPSFGSEVVLKSGAYERVRRRYATLTPVPTPGVKEPPLPHLMGVHAYFTEKAGYDPIELDLRVNNGAIAGNRSADPLEAVLGIVYWKSLELVVPKGWRVVPEVRDPFFAAPHDEGEFTIYPIVGAFSADASGAPSALHMMGPQAQFERRLVLTPGNQEARARFEHNHAGLAFAARGPGLWSWFEPETARYFARRDLLASVDFVQRLGKSGKAAIWTQDAANVADLRGTLETGRPRGYYVMSSVMGWAHPWFTRQQGNPGGEGIHTFEGHLSAAAASRDGYTYLELLHRMNVCRQPEAAFDRRGEIVGYWQWRGEKNLVPFDFRTNGGIVMQPFLLPMKWGHPPSDQVREVVRRKLRPPYDQGNPFDMEGAVPDRDDALLAWWPHDDQHLVRYTKNTKALVWLGNDAMAKDDLLMSAELFRLMRHESPHVPASWSAGVTLVQLEQVAQKKPHQGLWIGREDAWGVDAMCAAYSVASEEWRERNRAWFDRVSQLWLDGSLPNGLIQRFVNERVLGNTRYAVAQTFEHFFLLHAMRCMSESVYRGVDDARRKELERLAVRGIEFLMWGPPWARQKSSWQPQPPAPTLYLQGPRAGIAISPNDDYRSPPFSRPNDPNALPADGLGGGVEFFHPWAALSWAEEITRESQGAGKDNRYMKRALDVGKPHADWRALLDDFAEQMTNSSSDNSANWIGFLGKMQVLGLR